LASCSVGEAVVSTLLREDAAVALDSSIYSTAAASSSRPAGLPGVTPLTATSGGGVAATNADLGQLAAAIAAAGGDVANIVFVVAAPQAFAAGLQPRSVDLKIWPSRALAAGTIIAIEASAFVSAFGALPRIDISTEAVAHMVDISPATEISAAGTPNVVAAPLRSMWQTDSVLIRAMIDCAWTVRASGMVQYLTGAAW
jgi:hypothetical protein